MIRIACVQENFISNLYRSNEHLKKKEKRKEKRRTFINNVIDQSNYQ